MRRRGVIVGLGTMLGVLAAVLMASPALAGRGPKWDFLSPEPTTVPASFCGFEIQVTPVSSKQFAKVLRVTDESETALITGTLKLSYENLSTGKTITANVSSSSTFTSTADGSITVHNRGRAPLFLSPVDAQNFGLPTVSVVAGSLTESTDANGNFTLSLKGNVALDVCTALS